MNKLTESKTCGAKLRNKDAYCRNKAILVNGRCRNHGGLTPKGIASPHYKHGRYSRHLPTHLRDRYHETLNDPEITALRDDLALIDIHISKVLMEIYSPATEVDIKPLRDKIKLCKQELLECDPQSQRTLEVVDLLDTLDAAMGRGARNAGDISRLLPLLEQRRKTADSENRRVFRSDNSLSVEQAIAFVRLLGNSVKRHVTDPRQRSAVYEDFAKALCR